MNVIQRSNEYKKPLKQSCEYSLWNHFKHNEQVAVEKLQLKATTKPFYKAKLTLSRFIQIETQGFLKFSLPLLGGTKW